MTCVEFWNHVAEGGLEASPGSGHLAECAACAARWDRQQALAAGLRLVSAGMRGEEAPPGKFSPGQHGFFSRLRDAFNVR